MKINNHLHYVGVLNPAMRIFDIIMETGYGTSYNSYLVKGSEKTALIDASHETFKNAFLDNISNITDPSSIDYLIVNHTEPDHSGAIVSLLELNPDITIYATTAAIKNLGAITGREFKSVAVKDGDKLSLGDLTLSFIIAPNIHWPDTMMTYLEEYATLFSCDFLGAHFAEPTMYRDKVPYANLYEQEFKNYFYAIMHPFSSFVLKALDKIKDLNIELVCPSHGPLLNKEAFAEASRLYKEWSTPKSIEQKSVVIYYVSAYGYTRKMAAYLADKLKEKNINVSSFDVIKTSPEEISTHLFDDAFIFGSPTINRAALKPIWDTISSIDAVSAQGKPFATFGCYGWSGEACDQLNERLTKLKLKQVSESVRSRFAPTDETYAALDELAENIANSL